MMSKCFVLSLVASFFAVAFGGKPFVEVSVFHLTPGLYRWEIPVPTDKFMKVAILPANFIITPAAGNTSAGNASAWNTSAGNASAWNTSAGNASASNTSAGNASAWNTSAGNASAQIVFSKLPNITAQAVEVFARTSSNVLEVGGFDPDGTGANYSPVIITPVSPDVSAFYAGEASRLLELTFAKNLTGQTTKNFFYLRFPTAGYYAFFSAIPVFHTNSTVGLLDGTLNVNSSTMYGTLNENDDSVKMLNGTHPTVAFAPMFSCITRQSLAPKNTTLLCPSEITQVACPSGDCDVMSSSFASAIMSSAANASAVESEVRSEIPAPNLRSKTPNSSAHGLKDYPTIAVSFAACALTSLLYTLW